MFRRISQIGILALVLTCTAAFADQSSFSAVVPLEAPVAGPLTEAQRPAAMVNAADLKIELDGAVYGIEDNALAGQELHVVVDEEALRSGVIPAFRTKSEAQAFSATKPNQCGGLSNGPTNCRFCTGFNLTGVCFNLVGCTLGVNLNQIRSFETGCVGTYVCTGANLTGTCFRFTSAPFRAINYTGATPLLSGTCLNQ